MGLPQEQRPMTSEQLGKDSQKKDLELVLEQGVAVFHRGKKRRGCYSEDPTCGKALGGERMVSSEKQDASPGSSGEHG